MPSKRKSATKEHLSEEVSLPEEAASSQVAKDVSSSAEKSKRSKTEKKVANDDDIPAKFLGDPVPDAEARQRWPKRYEGQKQKQVLRTKNSNDDDDDEVFIQAKCHYMRAEVDGMFIYDLNDDAHVKSEEGLPPYICKIVEMFEGVDGLPYFRAQWYYRAVDTIIQSHGSLIDGNRVFFSEVQTDNPLDCLVEKLNIARVSLNVDLEAKKLAIPACDYYCDMLYQLQYSTFINLPPENKKAGSETSSTISSDVDANWCEVGEHQKSEVTLLDLYSGCGAMSTGLCLGANMGGLNLVTRWAVDLNEHACESLKLNHPETVVRNESAEDYLSLLKVWEKLCVLFCLIKTRDAQQKVDYFGLGEDESIEAEEEDDGSNDAEGDNDSEVFEVEKILDIRYETPTDGASGLSFKVRWKNYGPDEDSWEPVEGLSNCREKIKEFVVNGHASKLLPLPGDVDVLCGGPPCQGISGFNRFRNTEDPLADEKNKQLIVYMQLVDFLKPRFVLMENVVDIVKFAKGFLGRYALARLINMNYQVRLGMMAAGAYGLPQFRMRVFLWGARPTEKLPQYPLPTHDVVLRGVFPLEFERNIVAYDEGHTAELEKKLLLKDAIYDLPAVGNDESRDEMPYDKPPQTEFQRFIRLRKDEMLGTTPKTKRKDLVLYDHRPLKLNNDDYQRVCRIPKRKGANFRDLPGVRERPDNKVEWDPNVKRVYLDSGKPLVPDYAMTFVKGTSSKPFARLWWDETVPTVVTRAEPHNQAITHPEQDRVLTIRENARLQGFPDYYKLCGPIKERYIQVGNAVAVPVARALGYALSLAAQGLATMEPLCVLPPKFPNIARQLSPALSEEA